MKKSILFFLASAIFLMAFDASAKNPLGPNYKIQAAKSLKIDGDLSDWPKDSFVTYSASTVESTGGSVFNGTPHTTCKFAMMWDNEAFYLASEVLDDNISYNTSTEPYQWWTRDGVQWFLDFTNNDRQDVMLWPEELSEVENDPNQKWLPGEMIIVIGATEDQKDPGTCLWPVGTRAGNRSDAADTILEDGTAVRSEFNDQWKSIVKVTPNTKYVIEVKVPWASFEKSKYYSDPANVSADADPDVMNKLGWKPMLPKTLAGSTILFTHLCIDTDLPDGGYESQSMWVGDGDNDSNWSDATFVAPVEVETWQLF